MLKPFVPKFCSDLSVRLRDIAPKTGPREAETEMPSLTTHDFPGITATLTTDSYRSYIDPIFIYRVLPQRKVRKPHDNWHACTHEYQIAFVVYQYYVVAILNKSIHRWS